MPKFINLKDKKYGRLTVLKKDEERSNSKRIYWLCKCKCGNVVSVRSDTLGKSAFSCGCLKKEQDKKNLGRFTTGLSHTRLACIWYHMKDRCYNEKNTDFKNWGGRGIKVCDEWKNDFLKFKEWADANGYKDGLTIDRKNVNEDYKPSNCRWVTLQKQLNNKRTTLWVEHNGEWKSLAEAYKEIKPNISYNSVRKRYEKGIRDINELFKDRQYRGN